MILLFFCLGTKRKKYHFYTKEQLFPKSEERRKIEIKKEGRYMRKLASIQRIKEITPIEGADRIELATVLGWQVVVPKGQYKPNQLVVYFEIDSFLPLRPEFEFLAARSKRKNEILGEGYHLRSMTLKGKVSQGLIMSLDEVFYYILPSVTTEEGQVRLSDLNEYFWNQEDVELIERSEPTIYEGADVTNLLDIKEWVIPERAGSGGTMIGHASGKIRVTDETRVQSSPELLKEFENLDYYITLKIDGSSHSVKVDSEGKFHVFGHHYEYKDDGKSGFYELMKKMETETIMKKYMKENGITSMVIQGEYYGPGIQKNRLAVLSPSWKFFTIDEDENRVGLQEMKKFEEFCKENNNSLEMVPLLEEGKDLPSKYPTVEALLERAGRDDSHSYQNDIPEGIVIRPVEPVYSKVLGTSLSMKVINNNYLLKNKE